MTEHGDKHRPIRSFVLRRGRMTQGQRGAYERLWPRFGLDCADGLFDHEALRQPSTPLVLEIGFGMGASLVEMAAAAPDSHFIGVDVHKPGVGALLQRMAREEVENISVYCHDAVEVLGNCIPDDSLSRVQIYFPDPWHKKRHHKRRLIQPQFLALLRPKLVAGGLLHLATDWQPYAEQMMQVLGNAPGFDNCQGPGAYAPRPAYRPLTKFEQRGARLGHGVWDLLFEKCAQPPAGF